MATRTREFAPPATGTSTVTLTLANPSESTPSSSSQQQQPIETLTLKLKPKRRVSWKPGTVDNEFMNKKSSKICCIFHKEKPFDEDDSDDEDEENEASKKSQHGDHNHCCSKQDHGGEASTSYSEDH
ncbi:protein phosphatase 1 regulatory subunit INH3 [Capsicum chacoense]